MRVNVVRSSCHFSAQSPNWNVCPGAEWNAARRCWEVEVPSLEALVAMSRTMGWPLSLAVEPDPSAAGFLEIYDDWKEEAEGEDDEEDDEDDDEDDDDYDDDDEDEDEYEARFLGATGPAD